MSIFLLIFFLCVLP